MAIYETVFMSRQDLTDKQVKDLTEAFSAIITAQGGTILKTEQWGVRTLAYRINRAKRAHYTLIECEAPGTAIHEMERQMRINEDVVRYLTIRLEEPTKAQSKILDKEPRYDETNRYEEAA